MRSKWKIQSSVCGADLPAVYNFMEVCVHQICDDVHILEVRPAWRENVQHAVGHKSGSNELL